MRGALTRGKPARRTICEKRLKIRLELLRLFPQISLYSITIDEIQKREKEREMEGADILSLISIFWKCDLAEDENRRRGFGTDKSASSRPDGAGKGELHIFIILWVTSSIRSRQTKWSRVMWRVWDGPRWKKSPIELSASRRISLRGEGAGGAAGRRSTIC